MSDKSNIKNRAFSGVIWKFSERICAQVVSLVVSIILARILMPDDYSVVSIVTIFFTFSNVIISGGLSTALIQKKEADIVDYSSVLYISMLMAGVMYLIMFFTAPYIAALYNKDILVLVIRVMGLIFLSMPSSRLFVHMCQVIYNSGCFFGQHSLELLFLQE